MANIILDTNFLLIPSQFRVDIFSEISRLIPNPEIFILDKTIDELNEIIKSKQKPIDRQAAKLALQLIKAKHIKIIKTEQGNVDKLLAAKKDYIIATQDKNLKKKLKKRKIKTIILKQKKYLAIA